MPGFLLRCRAAGMASLFVACATVAQSPAPVESSVRNGTTLDETVIQAPQSTEPAANEPSTDAPAAAESAETTHGLEEHPTDGEVVRTRLMEISCRDPEARPGSWLDRTHSYLTQRLCEPAAWFDGFFGDERALEETPVGTYFRLRNEARWEEEDGFRVRLRASANIALPGASENLRLLFSRDEDVRGEFEPYLPVEESDKQTRIGLRYNLSEKVMSRLDIDGTVKVSLDSLNPVGRVRYRQAEQFTENSFGRFTQIGFWEAEEGFGTTTRLDWEWFRDYDKQLRFSTQGTWSEEQSNGIDWRYSVTGFRQLNPKTAIRTEIGAFGWSDPSWKTDEYFVNFRYRRSFLRPWLYYELQPEHAWMLDDNRTDRQGDWRFIATLEVQFENAVSREEREQRALQRWFDWLARQPKNIFTGRKQQPQPEGAPSPPVQQPEPSTTPQPPPNFEP
jgi:hypothetical protein